MRMWEDGRRKKLLIMGQRGIKERVELLMNLGYEGFLNRMNYIKFIEVDNGAELDGISIRTARTEHSLKNLAVRIDVDGKSICYSGDGKLTSDVIKLFRRSNLAICECYSIKPIVQTHSCLEDLRFDGWSRADSTGAHKQEGKGEIKGSNKRRKSLYSSKVNLIQ
jgi:ribonuclease BN (tRNA processing enzyme)